MESRTIARDVMNEWIHFGLLLNKKLAEASLRYNYNIFCICFV